MNYRVVFELQDKRELQTEKCCPVADPVAGWGGKNMKYLRPPLVVMFFYDLLL